MIKNENEQDLNLQSKSILISKDYEFEELYNLLIKNPQLINVKDQKNETFLSYALKRKNLEISELILTFSLLDLSYQDTKGNSYLHLAVINQYENVIKLLIKKGININLQNNEGNTALHYAYNNGDIKYIAILIENKADLNIKNNMGLTPEEIKIDSLSVSFDIYNNNLNISNNTDNSCTINMNDKNNIEKYNSNKNTLISTNKSKINETIKMEWENNEINNKNHNCESNIKYSLVNFSYSDDNNDDNEEGENNNNEIINYIDNDNDSDYKKDKAKTENMKKSDIFNLTSTLTYQEKLENAHNNNLHKVESQNENIVNNSQIDENDDDIVNINIKKLKTNENKHYNNYLINNSPNKKLSTFQSYKTEFEKYKKNVIGNNKYGLKSFNHDNHENKQYFDYITSISKEENNIKDIKDNGNNLDLYKNKIVNNNVINKNINNEDNTITYQPEYNDNFGFSPFGTIKESLNNNKNKNLERQQLFNNKIKNIKINNNHSLNNNISNNFHLSLNDNNEQTHPNYLHSKSNADIYSSVMTAEDTVNKSKNIDTLYHFLSEIKLEKYYNILNSNGFEDIQVLINQEKTTTAITDEQLKEAGINPPGDRAKILIRLQEKAGNFIFQIPKTVYYTCVNIENYMNDYNIEKLNDWLKALKIENYLENFIDAGYHSVELMLLQMESKNPITNDILKNELGIKKVGHRARIINKLLEEGKRYNNKLKTSTLIVGNGKTEKICDCIIF